MAWSKGYATSPNRSLLISITCKERVSIMATIVSGTLVYLIPVVFTPDESDARSPEDQFVAWAATQRIASPDGDMYAPGVSQDESRKDEEITIPFDGIVIDYTDTGDGNMKL